MLAGMAGVVAAENVEGERDLIYDALVGAAVVGSHVILDHSPYVPKIPLGPKLLGMPLINWAIDSVQWAVVAYLIWPKAQQD